jgi:hypothetical protein
MFVSKAAEKRAALMCFESGRAILAPESAAVPLAERRAAS